MVFGDHKSYRFCCLQKCKIDDEKIIHHKFPQDLDIRNSWIEALGAENIALKNSTKNYVCSKHFNDNDYCGKKKTRLKFGAIPKLEKEFQILNNSESSLTPTCSGSKILEPSTSSEHLTG